MKRFLLDTGPLLALGLLLKQRKIELTKLNLATLDVCWDELDNVEPSSAIRLDGQIEIIELPADSVAANALYSRYRSSREESLQDIGEQASVAYLAHEDLDSVFVTEEKGAAWLALLELGGPRVATSVDLIFSVRQAGLIDKPTFLKFVGTRVRKRYALGIESHGAPARFG